MPDEFAYITRNDALLDLVRAEIAANGPMPFVRFMDLVLYHPTLGYYRSGKHRIGGRGDYVTSPHLSPLFGAIVGRQIDEVWRQMGTPAAYDLVEMGAGDGRLLRDLLDWTVRARPDLAAALRPILVEPDASLREAQRRTLAHLDVEPRWVDRLDDLPPTSLEGFLVSNELVDSFPVRLFTVRQGALVEMCVDQHDGQLVEVEGACSTAPLPAHLRPLVDAMPDGARIELNEAAGQWITEVAVRLRRGVVLTFDYGYPAAQMYAPWRTQGTLMAFYRHSVSSDPLAHPGEQDLTAHVDFTTLALTGLAHGLEPAGFTSQREFLNALGIHEAVGVAGLPLEETLARRRAVLTLTDPAGLGRMRVLAQSKGVELPTLTGFAGSPPARRVLGING